MNASEWVQLSTTVVLVAITAWYAWHTRGMARTMEAEYRASHRPMLDFGQTVEWVSSGDTSVGRLDRLDLWIPVVNVGKVPVTYVVQSASLVGETAQPQAGELGLHPGSSLKIRVSRTNLKVEGAAERLAIGGALSVRYWRLGMEDEVHTTEESFSISVPWPIPNGQRQLKIDILAKRID
jgi:hypothetical protein